MGQDGHRELDSPLVHDTVRDILSLELERFKGLLHRMRCLPAGERIGSLDREWARAFEIPWISLGRGQNKTQVQQKAEESSS